MELGHSTGSLDLVKTSRTERILGCDAQACVIARPPVSAGKRSGCAGDDEFRHLSCALVIGTNDYAKLPKLETAVTDAEALNEHFWSFAW